MKKKGKKVHLQAKKRYLTKIFGTSDRPRLSVFRSNFHIYAQIIDDQIGKTLVSCSTLDKELKSDTSLEDSSTASKEAAFKVGEKLAIRALTRDIKKVVFDRGKKAYHGRIQKLAEGSREQGLIF